MLTACAQVRAEGWRPKRIPPAFLHCTLLHTHKHTHTFWLCKPERLAAHYHTTGGLHTGDCVFLCVWWCSVCVCVCQCTSEHCLLVITTTVPLFVRACQSESVFNQEDRKTEATENYWICFHCRDNHQIKQIHLVKQLIHLSNQQGGQRQQHLLTSDRCGDAEVIHFQSLCVDSGGGLFHPFEVSHLA